MIQEEHALNMINDWDRLNVSNDYVISSVDHINGHMDVSNDARAVLESARRQALKGDLMATWSSS